MGANYRPLTCAALTGPFSEGERKPVQYVSTLIRGPHGRLTPDGKWMAYESGESGSADIYVAPFPDPTAKWRISTAGGLRPTWRADSKELFYLAPDKTLMAVSMPSPDRAGVPVPLFKTTPVDYLGGRDPYSPSADGQRFLVNTLTQDAPPQAINVITNWRSLGS